MSCSMPGHSVPFLSRRQFEVAQGSVAVSGLWVMEMQFNLRPRLDDQFSLSGLRSLAAPQHRDSGEHLRVA